MLHPPKDVKFLLPTLTHGSELRNYVSLSFLLCSCVFNALRLLLFDSSRHQLPCQQFLVNSALIKAVQTTPQASVSLKDTHRCSERSHSLYAHGVGLEAWIWHTPMAYPLSHSPRKHFGIFLLFPATSPSTHHPLYHLYPPASDLLPAAFPCCHPSDTRPQRCLHSHQLLKTTMAIVMLC